MTYSVAMLAMCKVIASSSIAAGSRTISFCKLP